ncbi:MAG TPA: C25 family cysteine peptidase [Candidatus Krumholzibacteria bacterium]|nr:C25 family cysteine peptidase [Candidatus Krumholzibacteria bacterium]
MHGSDPNLSYRPALLLDDGWRWNISTSRAIGVMVGAKPPWFPQGGEGAACSYWSANGFSIAVAATGPVLIHFVTDQGQWNSLAAIGGTTGDLAVTGFGSDGMISPVPGGEYSLAVIWVNCAYMDDTDWGSNSNPPVPANYSLYAVLRHELGHVLGFTHLPWPNSAYLQMITVMPEELDWGYFPSTEGIKALDRRALECRYPLQNYLALESCDFNPVAFVDNFHYGDGVARWTVRHEWETASYVVMGCRSFNDSGAVLARVEPGVFEQAVQIVAGEFEWLKLVEVDTSGRSSRVAFCSTLERRRAAVPQKSQNEGLVEQRNAILTDALADAATSALTQMDHPTCVVYAPPSLTAVLQSSFADFWNARGHRVAVVAVPLAADDVEARAWVKSSILEYAVGEGVENFLLVSDWMDDFQSPLWYASPYWESKLLAYESQPWFPPALPDNANQIPTFLIPDVTLEQGNTARNYPYIFSDVPYADLDDDGSPDVVVARLPFGDVADVAVLCENMQRHAIDSEVFADWDNDVTLLGGDESGSAAQQVRNEIEVARDIVAAAWPSAGSTVMLRSDYSDYVAANAAVRDQLNFERPDLIAALGESSSRRFPGQFFKRQAVKEDWDMSQLLPGSIVSAVVVASCESALWQPLGLNPEWSLYRDFLSTPDRGAVAWIGPTVGSWQAGNILALDMLLEELCSNPYRPMGQSWLAAMKRAYGASPPENLLTLDGYVFFGNPLSSMLQTPEHTVEALVRKAGGFFLLPNAENVAVGCPAGDLDDLVIKIEVDAGAVGTGLTAEEIVVGQPNPHIALFADGGDIHADNAPTSAGGVYQATVTIDAFSGCGEFSLPVTVRNIPLGYVRVNVKSPDMVLAPATGTASTRGRVLVGDFATFGSHYPSSMCDCVEPKPYSSCADYVSPDTAVTIGDYSFFGTHYQHQFVPPNAAVLASNQVASQGTLEMVVEEEQPLVGQHKIRARLVLDDMEPFSTAVIALSNENELLSFSTWIPDPALPGLALCSEITRDGTRQVFVGVLMDDVSSAGSITIGTAEFLVNSADPIQLGAQDFTLLTGDVLASPGPVTAHSEQRQTALIDRRVTVTPPSYHNALAQNYPNPFNPTTTIAFSVAKDTNVDLRIYDVRGAAVRTLVSGRQQAGVHRIIWDGQTDRGQPVASGVYFYKLIAGSFTDTKKMTILK